MNCYYIIHVQTNRVLIISLSTEKLYGFDAYFSLGSEILEELKGKKYSGLNNHYSWKIEREQGVEYYTITSHVASSAFSYALGSPNNFRKEDLPPIVVSQPKNIDYYWTLKEVPEEPKPEDPKSTITGILLSSPAHMIREMCSAIADSQRALDAAALETQKTLREKYPELAEIGYQVTWYQIPEVTMEIKVAVHFEETANNKTKFFVSPFNARYQSQFKFTGDGSSNIKLRVVPIPPPIGTEQKR